MGIKDFFHFDEKEYADSLPNIPTHELKRLEVQALRKQTSIGYTLGLGAGTISAGGPVGFLVCGYGGRRLSVCQQRYKLIEAELDRRHIAMHEPSWKDLFDLAWNKHSWDSNWGWADYCCRAYNKHCCC